MASTRRRKFGATADCNVCDWRSDCDQAMARAGAHTRRTGHMTFVCVEYSIKLIND